MTDTRFYQMMGVLQLLISWINFYVAFGAAGTGSLLGWATAAVCSVAGVICAVSAAKLWGVLD